MDDLDQFLHQQMKNAGFRQAWQESQMDFDVAEMLIKARFEQRLSQRERRIRLVFVNRISAALSGGNVRRISIRCGKLLRGLANG